VLILTLYLVLFFVVVAIFLAAWSLWFQGYIYSEPAQVLPWRAPAAGAAVAAFVALWVILVARSHGKLATLWDFSASTTVEYKDVWATDADGKELARYKEVNGVYWLDGRVNGPKLKDRPDGLKVKEPNKDDKVWFKPDRDAKGNFKVEQVNGVGGSAPQPLKYRDDKGHVMEEGSLGRVTTFRYGWLFANVLLNVLHLAVWWLCLWLLLQFQWAHALGQSIVLWLVTMLFVLPPLFGRALA
jgi:hypothetical protein